MAKLILGSVPGKAKGKVTENISVERRSEGGGGGGGCVGGVPRGE